MCGHRKLFFLWAKVLMSFQRHPPSKPEITKIYVVYVIFFVSPLILFSLKCYVDISVRYIISPNYANTVTVPNVSVFVCTNFIISRYMGSNK